MTNLVGDGAADPSGLPIDAIREVFLNALARGPVVVSAPTGSGKSTQVPRWCPGPVLVIEPRRVACRSLAWRVAQLEREELGHGVGYHVRDERRDSSATRILFATPGIALQQFGELDGFRTIVVDEFHERRLDTDLLLALLRQRTRSLVVMSATLDGERIAAYLGGVHVRGEGRQFPVRIEYASEAPDVPEGRDLERRLFLAWRAIRDNAGDVLVFLPGKGEIAASRPTFERERDVEIVELHGGLTLSRQTRVFEPSTRRKVILATNVAETSVTVPGVGVVIDTGLVRRTRYHQGRGHLALVPIALDSADQRAGRAGRTAPGVCYRMWSSRARLAQHTPPEVHRESLVPLVLAAAACEVPADTLELLDPPKEHALESAQHELSLLGALDSAGALTTCGRQISGLPIDAWLGRLLVEAVGTPVVDDCIDLVAAISAGRPLFSRHPGGEETDLRRTGCDVTACVRAVRDGDARRHGLDPTALEEARDIARRLRRALARSEPGPGGPDRDALVALAIRIDERCVHVPRTRRGRVTWANGGTEIELGRESALYAAERVEALVVFDSRATGSGTRGTRVIATCASPVTLATLVKLGVGRDRVASAVLQDGRVLARIERVFARKTLGVRAEPPHGALAREAILDLFLRGQVFPDALRQSRDRLARWRLAAELARAGLVGVDSLPEHRELETWARARLDELGVESGDDLALLRAEDLIAPDLPESGRERIDREFPLTVSVGDASYDAEYDLAKRQVILKLSRGHRQTPPPAAYLPRFGGFTVFAEAAGTLHRVR